MLSERCCQKGVLLSEKSCVRNELSERSVLFSKKSIQHWISFEMWSCLSGGRRFKYGVIVVAFVVIVAAVATVTAAAAAAAIVALFVAAFIVLTGGGVIVWKI